MAAIRPGGKEAGVWALPKGIIGDGEKPEETALREVAEETGVEARLVGKLGDIRYVYTANWEERKGERIFKVVSFFLLRAGRGSSAEARLRPRTPAPRVRFYQRALQRTTVGTCTAEVPPVQWPRHSRGESARKQSLKQSGGHA